jgi:hypothetical protein
VKKTAKSRNHESGNLAGEVAAPVKLTFRKETRLLTLLTLGESLEASSRAINVSSTAIRKRMHRDAAFAHRVQAARENRPPEPPTLEELTEELGRENPGEWSFPNPFDLHGAA